MTERPIRVALFADCFNEINGVSNTCRQFAEFARRGDLPFLVISADNKPGIYEDGSVVRFGFRRGRVSFGIEKDLSFDLLFLRYFRRMRELVRAFEPDLIHITGPGDVGIAGAIVAHDLQIPLAASWHTNIHEYAARRSDPLLPGWLKAERRKRVLQAIEDFSFRLTALYFRAARFHFAPNPELIDRLIKASGRPCYLMERGVDQQAFSPAYRDRTEDEPIVIGYVGRLSTEKKVRQFAHVSEALVQAGLNAKIVFVGQGHEREWLAANVKNCEFTGVLRGGELARAYANMDVFAFPSETDTFGNVVLEALSSGVPAVVTASGGPKFIVEHGKSGFVAVDQEQFTEAVLRLVKDASLRKTMALEAHRRALRASWSRVFSNVYRVYEVELARAAKDRQSNARSGKFLLQAGLPTAPLMRRTRSSPAANRRIEGESC